MSTLLLTATATTSTEQPEPPIENDPHVFDLVSKDSSHFIHYGKSDTTVTSATVEKLVEKLTREMGMFVCIILCMEGEMVVISFIYIT